MATATGNCHDYPCWNLPYYLKESQVKKQTRHHYQQHQWCHTHPVLAAGSLKGQHLTGYLRGYCGMIFGCHLGVVLRARLILSQPVGELFNKSWDYLDCLLQHSLVPWSVSHSQLQPHLFCPLESVGQFCH